MRVLLMALAGALALTLSACDASIDAGVGVPFGPSEPGHGYEPNLPE